MHRDRLFPRILTACFAALVVAGCGVGPVTPGATAAVVTPMPFWHSMAGELSRSLRIIVDKFNVLHPETPVELVYQGGYDLLQQKIRTSVVAGHPPVMAQMYEAWTAYLNRDKGQEAIASLDRWIRDPAFNRADFFPVLLEDGCFDNEFLALPCNKSFPVLYYNKDLFRAAGLDPEKPPATWAELAVVGRKLTLDKDGDGRPDQWGAAFTPDPWIFLCMVLQNGGTFLSADGRTGHFDEPPAIEALQYWIDATRGPGRFAYHATEFDPQNDYVGGRVAMVVSTSVSKSFMKPLIRFDMGLSPMPQGRRKATIMAGTNVGIFRKTPPPLQRAAFDFLEFFCNTENTTYWAVKTNYIPVRKSAVESTVWKEWIKLDPTAAVPISQMAHASYEPRFPEWADCRKTLQRAMTLALQEGTNAAGRLRDANKEINAKLARRLGKLR